MFIVERKLIKLMFTQCSTLSATLGGADTGLDEVSLALQ